MVDGETEREARRSMRVEDGKVEMRGGEAVTSRHVMVKRETPTRARGCNPELID